MRSGRYNMKSLLQAFALFTLSVSVQASDKDLVFKTSCGPGRTEAVISFVGDILIHRALYETVANETQHFSQLWKKSESLFKKADFSVGNLEGPAAMGIDGGGKDHGDIGFVYDDFVYSGTHFSFNYHPRIFADLKNSGFDLLTNANNHSLDRTWVGIDRTISASIAAGLPVVGVRKSTETSGEFYKTASINGIRTAFIGCTEMTNGRDDSKKQILNCYENATKILSLIKSLHDRIDIDAVIVFTHWGTEYSQSPEASQKEFGRKYIEYGATAVIGSHPHVLQPWEKVVTKDGREGLILYSLGNFVAGQAGIARRTGPVAYLGLSKGNGKNEKASIFGVGYTPTLRTGAVISPVGKESSEVMAYVTKMYGTKAFIAPEGQLKSSLCTK